MNSNSPICGLLNIPTPQLLIMNSGPEVLVKESNLSDSILVSSPFSYKSVVILAPVGYPEVIPIESAKAPLPRNTKKWLHHRG